MADLESYRARGGRWDPPVGPETTRIEPLAPAGPVVWELAPSKSHMLRWLLLAAQGEKQVTLRFNGTPGEDIESMARCLCQLGVRIERGEGAWVVHGVGAHGWARPASVLNCANSGTALRLLTVAAARLDCPVMLDGDATLRARHSQALVDLVRALGVEVSHGFGEEVLPYLLRGPPSAADVTVDVSDSSQPLSALLLSMPAMEGPLDVKLGGEAVSRRHARLSFDLAAQTGSSNTLTWGNGLLLEPWEVECPEEVSIPGDRSLEAFADLYSALHGVELEVTNRPDDADALGAEVLDDDSLDLRDANDLLPPLAALLAIGDGGTITGAAHARHKESNRIERTVELLAAFGIEAGATEDGIKVDGNQSPEAPEEMVRTHADHRLWMTAACLATKVGGELDHPGIHAVSDPDFMSRIA
ncbi:MAG: hypothetical protein MK233_07495 [Candidatus Poseidoniales archaeon]|nr:hypothetical protein [Candidatus Poseidoniales archaeon]